MSVSRAASRAASFGRAEGGRHGIAAEQEDSTASSEASQAGEPSSRLVPAAREPSAHAPADGASPEQPPAPPVTLKGVALASGEAMAIEGIWAAELRSCPESFTIDFVLSNGLTVVVDHPNTSVDNRWVVVAKDSLARYWMLARFQPRARRRLLWWRTGLNALATPIASDLSALGVLVVALALVAGASDGGDEDTASRAGKSTAQAGAGAEGAAAEAAPLLRLVLLLALGAALLARAARRLHEWWPPSADYSLQVKVSRRAVRDQKNESGGKGLLKRTLSDIFLSRQHTPWHNRDDAALLGSSLLDSLTTAFLGCIAPLATEFERRDPLSTQKLLGSPAAAAASASSSSSSDAAAARGIGSPDSAHGAAMAMAMAGNGGGNGGNGAAAAERDGAPSSVEMAAAPSAAAAAASSTLSAPSPVHAPAAAAAAAAADVAAGGGVSSPPLPFALDSAPPTPSQGLPQRFVDGGGGAGELELRVGALLEAFATVLPVMDKLGPSLFLAIWNDEGNHKKLRRSWEKQRDQQIALTPNVEPHRCASVRGLLEIEAASGMHKAGGVLADPSAAIALLWMRRSLQFLTHLLRGLCDADATPSAAARAAYGVHLEAYHGWVLKQSYNVALNTMPRRDEVMQRLYPRVPPVEREAIYALEARECVLVLSRVVDAMRSVFEELDLEDVRRAPWL